MILKTRFGTLDLPRDDCTTCICTGKYMSCSTCDFKNGLIEAATEPYIKRQIMIEQVGELYKSPEDPPVKIYGGEWPRSNIVVVAGTFNRFHEGHRALIIRAVWEAMRKRATLHIGVTTDEFAQSTRDVPVRSKHERLHDVFVFAASYARDLTDAGVFYEGIEIRTDDVTSKDDMPAMSRGDVIVVSEETVENALRLLEDSECRIVVVPMRKDGNGKAIHATDIINAEKKLNEELNQIISWDDESKGENNDD